METKYVRVPFDLEMAKKITEKSVDGRIVTRYGESARIVCFDRKDEYRPIIVLIKNGDMENVYALGIDGKGVLGHTIGTNDLMLEIPEHMTFKDGDVLYVGTENSNNFIFINKKNGESKTYKYVSLMNGVKLLFEHTECCYCEHIKILRFATESEKQKLIDSLKESKEPKAKECLKMLGIEVKPECKFNPFDRVLVRYNDECQWGARFFDRMFEGDYACTDSLTYKQCLPYNDQTKHLLGTNDNWEE